MQLICARCFVNPLPNAGAQTVVTDLLLCGTGGASSAHNGNLTPRCFYCGSEVTIEPHHSSWYDF